MGQQPQAQYMAYGSNFDINNSMTTFGDASLGLPTLPNIELKPLGL